MTSLLLIGTLTGCVQTTEQKSARAKLAADRLLAGQQPLRVTDPDPDVSVLRVTAVGTGGRTAIVVTLRNRSRRVLSDLPILIGETTPTGGTTYLDDQPALAYFQTHVGAVGAGRTVIWVSTSARPPKPGGRLFARVGSPAVTDQAGAASLPLLTMSVAGLPSHGAVLVTVTNHSSVTQSGLVVYASATSAGVLSAGGRASLSELDGDAHSTVRIDLIGRPAGGAVSAQAPPVNLR